MREVTLQKLIPTVDEMIRIGWETTGGDVLGGPEWGTHMRRDIQALDADGRSKAMTYYSSRKRRRKWFRDIRRRLLGADGRWRKMPDRRHWIEKRGGDGVRPIDDASEETRNLSGHVHRVLKQVLSGNDIRTPRQFGSLTSTEYPECCIEDRNPTNIDRVAITVLDLIRDGYDIAVVTDLENAFGMVTREGVLRVLRILGFDDEAAEYVWKLVEIRYIPKSYVPGTKMVLGQRLEGIGIAQGNRLSALLFDLLLAYPMAALEAHFRENVRAVSFLDDVTILIRSDSGLNPNEVFETFRELVKQFTGMENVRDIGTTGKASRIIYVSEETPVPLLSTYAVSDRYIGLLPKKIELATDRLLNSPPKCLWGWKGTPTIRSVREAARCRSLSARWITGSFLPYFENQFPQFARTPDGDRDETCASGHGIASWSRSSLDCDAKAGMRPASSCRAGAAADGDCVMADGCCSVPEACAVPSGTCCAVGVADSLVDDAASSATITVPVLVPTVPDDMEDLSFCDTDLMVQTHDATRTRSEVIESVPCSGTDSPQSSSDPDQEIDQDLDPSMGSDDLYQESLSPTGAARSASHETDAFILTVKSPGVQRLLRAGARIPKDISHRDIVADPAFPDRAEDAKPDLVDLCGLDADLKKHGIDTAHDIKTLLSRLLRAGRRDREVILQYQSWEGWTGHLRRLIRFDGIEVTETRWDGSCNVVRLRWPSIGRPVRPRPVRPGEVRVLDAVVEGDRVRVVYRNQQGEKVGRFRARSPVTWVAQLCAVAEFICCRPPGQRVRLPKRYRSLLYAEGVRPRSVPLRIAIEGVRKRIRANRPRKQQGQAEKTG